MNFIDLLYASKIARLRRNTASLYATLSPNKTTNLLNDFID